MSTTDYPTLRRLAVASSKVWYSDAELFREASRILASHDRLMEACSALISASEVELDAERSDGTTEVYGRFISPEAWNEFLVEVGLPSP